MTILDHLHAVVGPNGWLDDPADTMPFVSETRERFHGRALTVISPACTEQVAEVLRLCSNGGIGVVPQGGNTGRCGGATPDDSGRQIVLSLRRLNRIRDIDPLNYAMIVEAGCILADVQAAARTAERLFPLSLGAEGSCQIGGNLATNAGGLNVLRYGNARDLALGLEVVLPTGEVWDGLNRLRKNNTGYDLKDLFIGSEGTLGVITAAVLKLFPLPADVQTAFVALRDLDACIELLARARHASDDTVTTFELISRTALSFALQHITACRDPFDEAHEWYVLLVFSGSRPEAGIRKALETLLERAYEDNLVTDAVVAASEAQAQSLWRLREGVVEAQRFEGGSIKHDVSAPVSRIPEFIRTANERVTKALPGLRVCVFGHAGDGNIHYNLSQPVNMDKAEFLDRWEYFNRIVHDIAVAMGGSFSAEHGVGRLKLDEMARYKSPVELELMRQIKRTLDPNGIMNPGKVVP